MLPTSALLIVMALAAEPPSPSPSLAHAGTPFDLQGHIDQALRAGLQRVVVPPGRYRVTPRHGEHLTLRDLNDVEIVADGVEMICTETTRALTFERCRNVSLRGLTIDYDPLPFTQGRITGLDAGKTVLDIELFAGYPGSDMVRNFKFEVFDHETRFLRTHDYDIARVEKPDARRLRLHKRGGKAADLERVGDLIVIGAEHAPGGSAAHAVVADHCVGLRLENVDLFASNCFGFLETNCDGSTYTRCRVDRRPAETDVVRRADPRVRSLDADAFHSKFALKGPALMGCVARFMGDDAVNICGSYHMVTECHGNALRVLANGDMLVPGEPIEVVTYEGVRLPDAAVVTVEPDGLITDEERAWLLRQHMDQGIRSRGLGRAFKVTLDRSVELGRGAVIASTRRAGNGFLVQGCMFGHNRSRGILIKASHGRIVDNILVGSWMEAIKVSPEYWWLESGSSNDLVIRGNTIRACRGIGIAVYAHGGTGKVAPSGAHRNITIADNHVERRSAQPNIAVTSTRGLVLRNNQYHSYPDEPAGAWAGGSLGLDRERAWSVMIRDCTEVTDPDGSINEH